MSHILFAAASRRRWVPSLPWSVHQRRMHQHAGLLLLQVPSWNDCWCQRPDVHRCAPFVWHVPVGCTLALMLASRGLQICVRSTVTWLTRTSAVALPSQGGTGWMPAAALWAWPGALNVTNAPREAPLRTSSSAPVAQVSLTGATSSTADPSSKVQPPPARDCRGSFSCWFSSAIFFRRYKRVQDDKHPLLKRKVQKHHRQFPLSLWQRLCSGRWWEKLHRWVLLAMFIKLIGINYKMHTRTPSRTSDPENALLSKNVPALPVKLCQYSSPYTSGISHFYIIVN